MLINDCEKVNRLFFYSSLDHRHGCLDCGAVEFSATSTRSTLDIGWRARALTALREQRTPTEFRSVSGVVN